MCLVKANIRTVDGTAREIADIVDLVIDGDAIRIRTLFGENHEIQPARLVEGDFNRNLLLIEEGA